MTKSLHIYKPQPQLFSQPEQTTYIRFLEFHNKFPSVYRLFEQFANELIKNGHDRLGAKMIIERIRWEMYTGSKDAKGFKINNDFTAYYSRLYIKNNPQHDSKFETRKIKS